MADKRSLCGSGSGDLTGAGAAMGGGGGACIPGTGGSPGGGGGIGAPGGGGGGGAKTATCLHQVISCIIIYLEPWWVMVFQGAGLVVQEVAVP